MLTANQHAAVLRKRHSQQTPGVNDLGDEDLLVRHYLHVATQGLYLTGDVGPYIDELHAAGLRLLTNRSWGLRKTEEGAIRTVVELALKHQLGIETY